MTQLNECDFVRLWVDESGNARKIESYDSGSVVKSFEVVASPSDSVVIEWDVQREFPYEKHVWTFADNQTVCAHYGGHSKDLITTPICRDGYHREVIEEDVKDSLKTVTISYYEKAEGNASYVERNVYKDARFLSYVQYDSTGMMTASKQLYYESYGAVSGQSVIGIDGTPIRCGFLEEFGTSYYKMRYVKNFLQTNVVIRGENEFGEECLITEADKPSLFRIDVLDNIVSHEQDPESERSRIGVMRLFRQVVEGIKKPTSVCYIHNLTKEGCIYKAGIRDGDLLISIDGWNYETGNNPLPIAEWDLINDGKEHRLTVLSPRPKQNGYEISTFIVKGEEIGSEIYKVYFTDKEVERLKKYLDIWQGK